MKPTYAERRKFRRLSKLCRQFEATEKKAAAAERAFSALADELMPRAFVLEGSVRFEIRRDFVLGCMDCRYQTVRIGRKAAKVRT